MLYQIGKNITNASLINAITGDSFKEALKKQNSENLAEYVYIEADYHEDVDKILNNLNNYLKIINFTEVLTPTEDPFIFKTPNASITIGVQKFKKGYKTIGSISDFLKEKGFLMTDFLYSSDNNLYIADIGRSLNDCLNDLRRGRFSTAHLDLAVTNYKKNPDDCFRKIFNLHRGLGYVTSLSLTDNMRRFLREISNVRITIDDYLHDINTLLKSLDYFFGNAVNFLTDVCNVEFTLNQLPPKKKKIVKSNKTPLISTDVDLRTIIDRLRWTTEI